MSSLLETEGWKVTGALRCLCPKCNTELSSNAFSRSCHKKKCDGWLGKPLTEQEAMKIPSRPGWEVDTFTTKTGEVFAKKLSKDLLAPARVADAISIERNATRPDWTRFQIAGVNEWVRHLLQGNTATYIRLRVRRVGMQDSPRYTSYRGNKYLGEHSSVELAMDAAEREEEKVS